MYSLRFRIIQNMSLFTQNFTLQQGYKVESS